MLSEALQRNAEHEARLSNIFDLFPFGGNLRIVPEIESLASRTPSAALQLRSAQNDITGGVVVDSRPEIVLSDD